MADESSVSSFRHPFIIGLNRHESPRPFRQSITDRWGGFFLIEGEGRIALGDSSLNLEPGDLILYEPHHVHQFSSLRAPWVYLWFHFTARPHMALENLVANTTVPDVYLAHFDGAERERVHRTLHEALELKLQSLDGHENALALLLIESAVQRLCDRIAENSSLLDPRIVRARRLLLLADGADMDSIARDCGMSHTAFYNLFRREMGCSPRLFREHALMNRAKQYLEYTGFSMQEIALQLGMPDQFYFSARFKKYTGTTPTRFRAEKRKIRLSGSR